MQDQDKTKFQLIAELGEMRRRLAELEAGKSSAEAAKKKIQRVNSLKEALLEPASLNEKLKVVTEQRQAAAQLEKYQAHLEDLVQERTSELAKINQLLVQEVSEREQAQRDLQGLVSLLRAVLEAISDGLLVGNLAHGIESLNRRFKEIWGLSDELVETGDSMKMLDFCANQTTDPGAFVKRIQELYSPSIEKSFDQIELINGMVLERRSTTYVIGEKTFGRVWNYRDITDRIRFEKELEVARDRAQAADNAKSAFLAMMSHEIRTPINAVMGLSYLCLQTQVTPIQKDYLQKIYASSDVLLKIINDILDFSKIEVGRLDIELIDFDLENVIKNVASMIALRAEQKEIELVISIDQTIPMQLVGDPLRLEQVIRNLADNAVKFTAKGQVVICLESLDNQDDRAKIEFSVSDTGTGLNEEQISNLFQPFVQADSSTTRKHGGSGLGLSICKRLVTMMGGEISVESQPDKGSTFSFVLEFARNEAAAEKRYLIPEDVRGTRVLLVDDNSAALENLEQILESFSFEITPTASFDDAIKSLEKVSSDKPFGLVIMDAKLPGLSTAETCARIRNLPQSARGGPAILILTDHDSLKATNLIHEGLADEFLSKPVIASDLFCSLMQVFHKDVTIPVCSTVAQSRQKEQEVMQKISGAQILLLEDNEINQQIASELLAKAGLVVTVVGDGQKGLNALDDKEFDAVLTDIDMPLMDGYEAATKIRDNQKFRYLPIIAMTAHAIDSAREKYISSGMNDFISKPIDPSEMYTVLLKWIPARESGVVQNSECSFKIQVPEPKLSLPDLPGIDLDSGLARLGGNKIFYLRLLRRFKNTHFDDANKIARALKSGDMVTAGRLAHTLAGLAGNFGANNLFVESRELEMAIIKGNSEVTANRLNSLRLELDKIVTSISVLDQTMLDSDDEAVQDFPMNAQTKPSDIMPMLEKIKSLMEKSDAGALDIMADIETRLAGSRFLENIRRVRDALEQYDFDNGLEILDIIIEELDSSDSEK